jgi:hypothetical protein
MTRTVSILYFVTAFVTGYWECYLLVRPINGGPWSWWYPITLGASIVLLVGGIFTIAPRTKQVWLVALALAIPLLLCSPFGWSWSCARYAVSLALLTWGVLALASAFKQAWLVAVAASLVLASWWLRAAAYNLSGYLSPKPSSSDSMALFWVLTTSVLVITSLIVGVVSSRFQGAAKGGKGLEQPAKQL